MGSSKGSSILRADEICEQVFCLFSLSLFFWAFSFFLWGIGGGRGRGGERAMMFYTREQAVVGRFCQVQLGMCTPGRIRHLQPSVMQEPLLKHLRLRGEHYGMH